jgi:hypothetical protein
MKKILLSESIHSALLSSMVLLAGVTGASTMASTMTGCSSKSAAPFPDVTSFCTAKAQAECQIASTCGLTSATDCVTAREALCNEDADAAEKTGSGMREYTQANAKACIDKANAVFGNGVTTIPFAQLVGHGSETDVCEHVFAGDVPTNKDCTTSYDCSDTGDICTPTLPGSTILICAPPSAVALGAFCQDPGAQCAAGSYCTMPSSGGAYMCVAEQQQGQSCASAPCADTERCVGGACMPRAQANEQCASDDDCAPTAPYCDPYVGNLCEQGLSLAVQSPDCKGFTAGTAAASSSSGSSSGGSSGSSSGGEAGASTSTDGGSTGD